MGTVLTIIIVVVLGAAILGFIFSKGGEKEEGAIMGAVTGASFLLNLLPIAVVIAIVVLIVKSCS